MAKSAAQAYKENALKKLPNDMGVYALCDLDQIPIYIGQSTDGINARVRRHLTSARSDVIANRQIDVWEIAFVWAWPLEDRALIGELESHLFYKFDKQSPLVNGKLPIDPGELSFDVPERVIVQVMDNEEIAVRQDPVLRFPRQIQHFGSLMDYILNTQDKPHLRRALEVYFDRLGKYYKAFKEGSP